MDILEIEKILNRVALHLEETNTNLPFNFPTIHEVKRAFENNETSYSKVVLSKFSVISKLYELITN